MLKKHTIIAFSLYTASAPPGPNPALPYPILFGWVLEKHTIIASSLYATGAPLGTLGVLAAAMTQRRPPLDQQIEKGVGEQHGCAVTARVREARGRCCLQSWL